MPVLFYSFLVLGIVLVVWRGTRAANSMKTSEESAHLAALIRRKQARSEEPESRRERRYRFERRAIASVLGSTGAKAPCQIVNTSRSGMRIVTKEPFPTGAQVQVQWDDQFFVGAVCFSGSKDGDYISGLELVACSYSNAPALWLRLLNWATSIASACVMRLSHRRSRTADAPPNTGVPAAGSPADETKPRWTQRLAS